jgi:hypothetical protein
MEENALSTIAASCSVDLERPKADIEKTRRPAPRTTRTIEQGGKNVSQRRLPFSSS